MNLSTKLITYLLRGLLVLLAINAFGGGYYGMAGAKGVPLEWLRGSPFRNYFVPSLFLFLVVGRVRVIRRCFTFSEVFQCLWRGAVRRNRRSIVAGGTDLDNWIRVVDAAHHRSSCHWHFGARADFKTKNNCKE